MTYSTLAVQRFGEPTARNGDEWRWRSRGSLACNVKTGKWYDFESAEGGTLSGASDAPSPEKQEKRSLNDYAAALWNEAMPITGTLGEVYLRSRAIEPPYPPSLRFHPNLKDQIWRRPGVIAARTLIDRPSDVSALQRIFLCRDGHAKAPMSEPKKSMGRCKSGGVVLGEILDAAVIAEGVETALSASRMFGLPAVATLGTAFTRALMLPQRVRRVVIAADNDSAGQSAASVLAGRLEREGRSVSIERPPEGLKDFNDLAQMERREPWPARVVGYANDDNHRKAPNGDAK